MIKRLFGNLIDEVIVAAITAALYGIIVLILGVAGYTFESPLYIVAVVLAVVYLLYYPIAETICKKSVGKKLLNI